MDGSVSVTVFLCLFIRLEPKGLLQYLHFHRRRDVYCKVNRLAGHTRCQPEQNCDLLESPHQNVEETKKTRHQ